MKERLSKKDIVFDFTKNWLSIKTNKMEEINKLLLFNYIIKKLFYFH